MLNKDYNNLIKVGLYSLIVFLILITTKTIVDMKKNENFRKDNEISASILNNSDFILGLKSISQLEYAVMDTTVNINEDDDYYKTFENNKKYEIFIDKKSGEINSLHYTVNLNDENNLSNTNKDDKYIKNIYNLTFSNMSSYMMEKTKNTIEHMCDSSYIANKNSSILKNSSLSESILIGKTSEIKVTVSYHYNGSKDEPEIIDIAILKGNKW